MARVLGPAFSLAAYGSLGRAIAYTNTRGRPQVRKFTIPGDPFTLAQRPNRMLLRFAGNAWRTLAPADQATWQTLADQNRYSPFNAYTATNLRRLRDNLHPTQNFAAAQTPPTEWVNGMAAFGTKGKIEGWVRLNGTPANAWGIAVFCLPGTTNPDGDLAAACDFRRAQTINDIPYAINNLAPGPYRLGTIIFSTNGGTSSLFTGIGTNVT